MEVATATMDSSNTTTPYTIVVSSDEEEQQQQQQQQQQKPSKQQEVLSSIQEAWEQTSQKVQEAWDAVTHHTVTQVEQTQRAVGPALEQAGKSVSTTVEQAGSSLSTTVAAVHRSASDLSQAAGDHTRALSQAAGDNARGLSMATQVAALTTLQATKQSLASIGSNPLTRDADTGETVVKGEKTDGVVTNVAMIPVAAVTSIGLVSGMVSFFMISAQLVDLASITLMIFAPYVAYQKWQLSSLGGLRGQQNRLRKSANRLSEQNGVLKRSMDHLEAQVKRYVTV
jgi:hypothetical protein